jgi:pSer/pThr/pTyr-binding forkhead associated (FHA) protein
MGILDKARTLESRIARAVNRAAEGAVGSNPREPLEIAHAIVDAVECRVQSGGRGARLFPFNRVAVRVLAPSREARAQLEALFASSPSIGDRIVDRLRSSRCDVADLQVDVAYVDRTEPGWSDPQFQVAFDRVAAVPAPIASTPARVEVTVLRGEAERRTYSFVLPRIDLGRGVEVRDHRHRLLRTNHVVFVEGAAGVNQTVSRRHAHITVDPSSGDCRLHDDRSVQGTGIVRSSRTIAVPPGSRGARLRSGDEIVLGDARLRVRIGDPAAKDSEGGHDGSPPDSAPTPAMGGESDARGPLN